LLAGLFGKVQLRNHVGRVLNRVIQSPVTQEHELQFHLLRDVANFPALTAEVELEQVKAFSISYVSVILHGSLIWHVELHFFLALLRFVVLFLEVDFLVEDLVGKADDAPPEDVISYLVQLLGEFVKDRRAALSEEISSVIINELHFLLSL